MMKRASVSILFVLTWIAANVATDGFAQIAAGTYSVQANVPDGYLNLRSGPGQGYPVVAEIPAGSRGVVVGRCQPPDDGRSRFHFCEAAWNGRRGWVSSCCLAVEVAVRPPVATTPSTEPEPESEPDTARDAPEHRTRKYKVRSAFGQGNPTLEVQCQDQRAEFTFAGAPVWGCQLADFFEYTIRSGTGQKKPVTMVCSAHKPAFKFVTNSAGRDVNVDVAFYTNGSLQRCEAAKDFTYDLGQWSMANGGDADVICTKYSHVSFHATGQLRECTAKLGRYPARGDGSPGGPAVRLYDCRGTVRFHEDGSLDAARSNCNPR